MNQYRKFLLIAMGFMTFFIVSTKSFALNGVSITELIAKAKSKIWQEYPGIEEIWPPCLNEHFTIQETVILIIKKTIATTGTTTTIATTTITEKETQSTGDYWIDEIVRLTNEARINERLSELKLSSSLNLAASIRVNELPNSPDIHIRPNGEHFYTVFNEVGLSPSRGGENYSIATANCYSPEQIVNAWLASPTHKKNIMNGEYTKIGIGHCISGDDEYFEQLFTN